MVGALFAVVGPFSPKGPFDALIDQHRFHGQGRGQTNEARPVIGSGSQSNDVVAVPDDAEVTDRGGRIEHTIQHGDAAQDLPKFVNSDIEVLDDGRQTQRRGL